jgi:flagellar basal-body rod modification protein FlgD
MIDTASVDNIKTITAAGSSSAKSAASQTSLDKTFNDFLLLLTTQLKNQDPLDPQDASEFTSQLAQMSGVQEQVNTNANLEKLISLVNGSQLSNVVSYIGRAVEASGNQSSLISNGDAQGALFAYDLPKEAQTATITITNATGNVVYSGNAPLTSGRNEVVWDGSNSFTGQKMPNGVYKFNIIAKDSAGESIKATTYTTGIVTSVDTKDGKVSLALGGINVKLEDVTAIRTAQELL